MKNILILFILIFPFSSLANDCWKKVYVQEIITYGNPTPFFKDGYSEKVEKGKKKWIEISCEVFESVSVGDYLKNKDQEVSGFNFFNKKKRFLEKKKYLILRKN